MARIVNKARVEQHMAETIYTQELNNDQAVNDSQLCLDEMREYGGMSMDPCVFPDNPESA